MGTINFFTPVRYESGKTVLQSIQEGIDDYFYLKGKAAYVISGYSDGKSQGVRLKDVKQNLILLALKVISYVTAIIPLLMLVAKAIFRGTHKFYVIRNAPPPSSSSYSSSSSSSFSSSSTTNSLHFKKIIYNNDTTPTSTVQKSTIHHTHTLSDDIANTASVTFIKGTIDHTGAEEKSVSDLMDIFTKAWDNKQQTFNFSNNFMSAHFASRLLEHANSKDLKKDIDEGSLGTIEKFDLDPKKNPKIYIRADLHGDLKSLIENIRTLKDQHLLNDDYKCKDGTHLVFLGDYCDRGPYGTQILEMLMCLQKENPGQIHLIRGNHEYTETNDSFGKNDERLMSLLSNDSFKKCLNAFYETMSLTTYFSVKVKNGHREYIQCTHGLFEPTMDPSIILDSKDPNCYMVVPEERSLTERIKTLAENGNSPLQKAAQRIKILIETSNILDREFTAYNWADIIQGDSQVNNRYLGRRQYKLNAQHIRDYLDISSETHKVMMLFRGHQHEFQHLMLNNNVVATTLPVGMNSPYKDVFSQQDRAYIITPSAKVNGWIKQAFLRTSSENKTEKITKEYDLTSSKI